MCRTSSPRVPQITAAAANNSATAVAARSGDVAAAIADDAFNGGVLVLSVLYSCILFKEKLSLAQGIGIGLSMVSIIALSL